MHSFSTHAIMLRRVDFGDHDLILTFLTPDRGKISAIAKSAKKSKKRFGGILELFSVLQVVCTQGRGLPILQEATLTQSFMRIRSDMKKTTYASYWAELINGWTESEQPQTRLYHLFHHVLEGLDRDNASGDALSILFQMRFMTLAGFYPNLNGCGNCGIEMACMKKNRIMFDLVRGEIICETCASSLDPNVRFKRAYLSKGTIKQLLWIENGDLRKAERTRFSPQSLKEGLMFLEKYVPYHLGKMPRSLAVLRQIRR